VAVLTVGPGSRGGWVVYRRWVRFPAETLGPDRTRPNRPRPRAALVVRASQGPPTIRSGSPDPVVGVVEGAVPTSPEMLVAPAVRAAFPVVVVVAAAQEAPSPEPEVTVVEARSSSSPGSDPAELESPEGAPSGPLRC